MKEQLSRTNYAKKLGVSCQGAPSVNETYLCSQGDDSVVREPRED